MPQDETSEAEVEAGAKAMAQLRGYPIWSFVGEDMRLLCIRYARAALTAAAQVRAQANNARENSAFDYIVNCARPNCDGVHGVEKLVDAPHGVEARDCSCHMVLIGRKGEG